jgi:hypothetical protein
MAQGTSFSEGGRSAPIQAILTCFVDGIVSIRIEYPDQAGHEEQLPLLWIVYGPAVLYVRIADLGLHGALRRADPQRNKQKGHADK